MESLFQLKTREFEKSFRYIDYNNKQNPINKMAIVTLPHAVEKTVVAAQVVSVTTLTITRVVDLPEEKIVRAFVKELPGPIELWAGSAYDAAGQWTDSDVNARIIALMTA